MGVWNEGVSRSERVLRLLSFLRLSPLSRDFPDCFGDFPDLIVLFLFLGLWFVWRKALARNIPERDRDTIRSFVRKNWEPHWFPGCRIRGCNLKKGGVYKRKRMQANAHKRRQTHRFQAFWNGSQNADKRSKRERAQTKANKRKIREFHPLLGQPKVCNPPPPPWPSNPCFLNARETPK